MGLDYSSLKAYIDGLYDNDNDLSPQEYNDIINYILANGDIENAPRDLIQVRRGDKADLPTLAQGELGFTLDTEELFVGGLNGNIKPNNLNIVNVKNFGATGDGETDDTNAINNAIQYCKNNNKSTLFIPKGTYIINGEASTPEQYFLQDGGLFIDFPLNLLMENETYLKAKTSSQKGYILINIKNTSNVNIIGGNIVGERDTHDGTTGEFGFGVHCKNVKKLKIINVNIYDFWGDGIILDAVVGDLSKTNEDVIIKNCEIRNNRRQGITIAHGYNFIVDNNKFLNSGVGGTDPKSAIDIEGVGGGEGSFVENCLISNNFFSNGEVQEIVCSMENLKNLTIDNNIFYDVGFGINISPLSEKAENINISNNIINNCSTTGINFSATDYLKNVVVDGNEITTNNTNQNDGIEFVTLNVCENVNISNNIIKGVDDTNRFQTGIVFSDVVTKSTIENNIVENVYTTGLSLGNSGSHNVVNGNNVVNCDTGISINGNNNIVESNKLKDIAFSGIKINGLVDSKISNNLVSNFAIDSAGDGGIFSSNSSTGNNLINSNLFTQDTSDSLNAIVLTNTTTELSNIVINNVALYDSGFYNLDANNVSATNYTG